jgi:hypothetical protein
MDAFDRWWQWAQKPLDRRDRIKVNEAVRKTAEADDGGRGRG